MARARRIALAIITTVGVLGPPATGSQAAHSRDSMATAAISLVWHTIPSMHTGRYEAGAEWHRESLLVIGGLDGHGSALRSVESYDLDYNLWTAASPMPTPRADFGMFTYGPDTPITVLGGADSHGTPLNVVEQYNPETDQWSRLAPMPQARRGLSAAQEAPEVPGEGDLLVAGGIGPGGTVLNSVTEEIENIPKHGDHTWRPLTSMHTPRSDFALVVGGNQNNGSARVYAIGGFGPGHHPLRSVEAYNRRTNRWTMVAPMPTARGGAAAQAVDSGRLITVAGGFDDRGGALTTVEQYNVATNTWTTLPPMPVARGGLALVTTEGTGQPGLFALGGRGTGGAVLASAAAREATLPRGWSLETPLPRRESGVVTVHDAAGKVYAFSGDGKGIRFDPSTKRWRALTPRPATSRSGGPAAAVLGLDGKIYVLGAGAGTAVDAYDPTTNTWTGRARMPTRRSGEAAATGKDGKIYLLGGSEADTTGNSYVTYPRSLEVYDPKTNTWQAKAPMPTGREGLGAAVGPDGTVYTLGGAAPRYYPVTCLSIVEAYDPRSNRWSRKPALPQPMCDVTAGSTAHGTITAVAGSAPAFLETGARTTPTTGTILSLRPDTQRWTAVTRAPYLRVRAGVVVEPTGTVYVLGGTDAFGDATATVQTCTRCGVQ